MAKGRSRSGTGGSTNGRNTNFPNVKINFPNITLPEFQMAAFKYKMNFNFNPTRTKWAAKAEVNDKMLKKMNEDPSNTDLEGKYDDNADDLKQKKIEELRIKDPTIDTLDGTDWDFLDAKRDPATNQPTNQKYINERGKTILKRRSAVADMEYEFNRTANIDKYSGPGGKQKLEDVKTEVDAIDADSNTKKHKNAKNNRTRNLLTLVGLGTLVGYGVDAILDADEEERECIDQCLPDDWNEYVANSKGEYVDPNKWITNVNELPTEERLYYTNEAYANYRYLEKDATGNYTRQVKPTYKVWNAIKPRAFQIDYTYPTVQDMQTSDSFNDEGLAIKPWTGLSGVENIIDSPTTYATLYHPPILIEVDASGDYVADVPKDSEIDEVKLANGLYSFYFQCKNEDEDEDPNCELTTYPDAEDVSSSICTEENMSKLGIAADTEGCTKFCKSKCQTKWTTIFGEKLGNTLEEVVETGADAAATGLEALLEPLLEMFSGFLNPTVIIVIVVVLIVIISK